MIQMKMLKSERGSQDGFTVDVFEKGQVYNLSDSLAESFIKMKSAEIVVKTENKEPKNVIEASENNAFKQVPEKNKKPKSKFSMKESILNDK